MNVPLRLRAAALALPVLLIASAGCDLAMADHKATQTAEWRKSYQLQPGGRVEIINVNGAINVTPGDGNAVEIIARKSASAASAEAAKEALARIDIKDESSASAVKVETKLLRTSNSPLTLGLFDGGNLKVEYSVRVPRTVELRVSTVNGGVEVAGVGGKVSAEATNGGIRARDIAGPIDATTTNGGVDVDVAKVSDAGIKLECTNGGIRLRLPSDARATISARITNGGIETSGLTLDSSGEASRRRLDGRLNGGGPRIELEGTNGGIRIAAR